MKKLIRQCVGIDVSKDTLDVAISVLDEEFKDCGIIEKLDIKETL